MRLRLWVTIATLLLLVACGQDNPVRPSATPGMPPATPVIDQAPTPVPGGPERPSAPQPAPVPTPTLPNGWFGHVDGRRGCVEGGTYEWDIVVGEATSDGYVLGNAFWSPNAGCGATDQRNGGSPEFLGEKAEFRTGEAGVATYRYTWQDCGRAQVDIAISDLSGNRTLVLAAVINTGVDCAPETPPETPPAPPEDPPAPPEDPEPPVEPPTPPEPPEPPCVDDCDPEPPGPEKEGLCHIWAGNDGFNEVTLYLSPSAVRAHLRQHQHDYLGPCEGHSPNPEHPEN